MLLRTLLVANPPSLRARLRRLLALPDLVVADAAPEGLPGALAADGFDLLLAAGEPLAAAADGLAAELRRLPDRPELIVLREREDAAERARLLAAGCLAVLHLGLPDSALGEALAALLRRSREVALDRLEAARRRTSALSDLAFASPAMRKLVRMAERVAAADSSLFILGETGVGKEWLARAIHAASPRARAPMIAVNCAALPESLLESELFGHEKGAFTGAHRSRRGCFELAHGGTLFLDEIAEMSPHIQAKLLRALQERKVQRLGSETLTPVDVRVMAATSRDLQEALASGEFRKDLYYRVAVVTLDIPPLRERREDVATLVRGYLEHFRVKLGRGALRIADAPLAALESYVWPGNVRELINVVERTALLAEGPDVRLDDLPEEIARGGRPERGAGDGAGPTAVTAGGEWLDRPLRAVRRQAVDEVERRYLSALLARTGGRISETARRAGIEPRSLHLKMRRLGLRKEDFKAPLC